MSLWGFFFSQEEMRGIIHRLLNFYCNFSRPKYLPMKEFRLVLLILILLAGTSFSYGQEKKAELDENFIHVVYFWLNNPESAQDRQRFETSLKKLLKNSEYTQTNFIGVPADTPRGVVDNSYTYSLILSFPSKEIQDKYQGEPAHLTFIEESSGLWKKVQVYDSVGIE